MRTQIFKVPYCRGNSWIAPTSF